MKQAVLVAVIVVVGLAAMGCQPESFAYRYRAGSLYEYEQLVDAWIPNNGTPAPLPPGSEEAVGRWVQVPVYEPKPVSYSSYHRRPSMYVGTYYGGGRSFGRGRYGRSLWGPRWRRGSGLSIGFSFGSGPRWPRYGSRDVWNDWFCEWPCRGVHGGRHLGW